MKKEDFEIKVKDLTFSPEEKFKLEQVNELIEKLEQMRVNWNG